MITPAADTQRACAARPHSARIVSGMLLATLLLAGAARADQILVSQTTLFSSTEQETLTLDAPAAGTISIELTDLGWPTALQSLSFSVSNSLSLLTPEATKPNVFDVTGAEALYAHISGVAGSLGIPGLPDFGLFSLQVTFTPSGAPVPLPAGVWLLLSGLLGLVGIRVLQRKDEINGQPAALAG